MGLSEKKVVCICVYVKREVPAVLKLHRKTVQVSPFPPSMPAVRLSMITPCPRPPKRIMNMINVENETNQNKTKPNQTKPNRERQRERREMRETTRMRFCEK